MAGVAGTLIMAPDAGLVVPSWADSERDAELRGRHELRTAEVFDLLADCFQLTESPEPSVTEA
jgi:hypothetical protein